MQSTVVKSIELQINGGGSSRQHQNGSGTGMAKFAGAAPLMTVQWTAIKAAAQAEVMPLWLGLVLEAPL